MSSNGKTTKTKFVDLNENYNFVVDDFFIEFVTVPNIYFKILKSEY